jgi:hypothetical protein
MAGRFGYEAITVDGGDAAAALLTGRRLPHRLRYPRPSDA